MTNSTESESSDDSDKGIRYKTESTRNKSENSSSVREKLRHSRRRRSSSDEEYERRKRRKEKKRKRDKESRHYRSENHIAGEKQISIRKSKLDQSIPEKKKEHSANEENVDTSFGPVLPPHLLKPKIIISSEKTIEDTNYRVCQMLPPQLLKKSVNITNSEDKSVGTQSIGPALPPHLVKPTQDDHTLQKEQPTVELLQEGIRFKSPETVGSALPSHLLKSIHKENVQDDVNPQVTNEILPKSIGPTFPPHLQKTTKEETDEEQTHVAIIGPTLPSHLRKQLAETSPSAVQRDYDDDDCYGPLPEGAPLTKSHLQLEERSLQLKIDQLNPEGDEPKREEWMLELPTVSAANLGLGPRTFRMKGTPDMSDRSSWTDTPQDKAKKQGDDLEPVIDIKKEAEIITLQKRDKQQEEIVKKSKRSSESLVDMHKKKMKEKKKDEPASNERRPFSRDVDLQVNRFDEAQKKAVLKKAQLLDDRFSSGQSKFL